MPNLRSALTLAIYTTFMVTGCFDSSSSSDSTSTTTTSTTSNYKTSLFVKSPAIPGGSNGFNFDDKDQMHLTSLFGRAIHIIDTDTGEIKKTFTVDDGIGGPDDIVLDADNNMYWTSFFSGEVGKTTPSGKTTTQFISLFVNPIAFANDGRLFVGIDFFGSGLYEIDPNQVEAPKLIDSDVKLNGMEFGPDGLLYASAPNFAKVVRIDVDQDIVTDLYDSTYKDLGITGSVKFNSKGEFHSFRSTDGMIYRMDLQTDPLEIETIGYFSRGMIDNLEFDSKDRLFISNSHDGSVVQMLADGTTRDVVPPGFVTPGGIAIRTRSDGGVSVFLADLFTLVEFDAETGEELSTAHEDLMPGGFLGPATISLDGRNFITTSSVFPGVQIWDHDNREPVMDYQGFVSAVNAIRFQDKLVVAEMGADLQTPRLILMDDSGENRQTIADANQGLVTPAGLLAKEGNLWVSDWSTGKLLQIASDGIPLTTPITVATGLDKPEGLAIDSAGRILIVESGKGQVSRLDLVTGHIDVLATKLGLGREGFPGMLPTFMFNGIAVDDKDVIYVTGEIENAIYRIEPK